VCETKKGHRKAEKVIEKMKVRRKELIICGR